MKLFKFQFIFKSVSRKIYSVGLKVCSNPRLFSKIFYFHVSPLSPLMKMLDFSKSDCAEFQCKLQNAPSSDMSKGEERRCILKHLLNLDGFF
jgi:hypothetical protein